MDQKVSTEEIPHQAYLLFIKLYCNRKGNKDKKTLQEARKSWAKLRLRERKPFYKTSAESNVLKYAHSLRKTKAYLKGNFPRKLQNVLDEPQLNKDQEVLVEPDDTAVSLGGGNATENVSELSMTDDLMEIDVTDDDNQNKTNLEVTSVIQSNSENNQQADDGSLLCCPTQESNSNGTRLEETVDTPSNTNCNLDGTLVMPLKEPEPPKVVYPQELYEMLRKPGDKDYKYMTKRERYPYQEALASIKRTYIKKYTQYLESLSQQQLFDHYMKTLH